MKTREARLDVLEQRLRSTGGAKLIRVYYGWPPKVENNVPGSGRDGSFRPDPGYALCSRHEGCFMEDLDTIEYHVIPYPTRGQLKISAGSAAGRDFVGGLQA